MNTNLILKFIYEKTELYFNYNMNNSKMDLQIEAISTSLSSLAIDETKIIKMSVCHSFVLLQKKKIIQSVEIESLMNGVKSMLMVAVVVQCGKREVLILRHLFAQL